MEGSIMIIDKKYIKSYYNELKMEFCDLCHEDPEYSRIWIEKARNLRLVGAWWHYKVLIAQAKRYVKENCPKYLKRFERVLSTYYRRHKLKRS